MSTRSHFGFARGDDVILNFTMTPVPASGISGWTTALKIVTRDQGRSVVGTVAGVVVSAGLGTLRVTIPAATTAGLSALLHDFFLRRTDSGYAALLADGTINVGREV